jgi:hypothetical protein
MAKSGEKERRRAGSGAASAQARHEFEKAMFVVSGRMTAGS